MWDLDEDDIIDYSPPSPESPSLPELSQMVEAWELDRSMEAPAIGKLGCAGTSWLNFSITSSIYSIRPTPSVTHMGKSSMPPNSMD